MDNLSPAIHTLKRALKRKRYTTLSVKSIKTLGYLIRTLQTGRNKMVLCNFYRELNNTALVKTVTQIFKMDIDYDHIKIPELKFKIYCHRDKLIITSPYYRYSRRVFHPNEWKSAVNVSIRIIHALYTRKIQSLQEKEMAIKNTGEIIFRGEID